MIDDKVRKEIESLANVVAVGTRSDGTVVVGVTEKLPETQLASEDIVPKKIDGHPSDVIEFGNVTTLRTDYYEPAPAGVSCGHEDITAGTWGSPPLTTEGDEEVILTNAHVAAPTGKSDVGDPILQPGPYDGGIEPPAGRLHEFSDISSDADNKSDSALFKLDARNADDHIIDIGSLDGFGDSKFDETVRKSGRTTGLTTASLLARNVSVNVSGYFPDDTARFIDVDAYSPSSAGGDSGSLIVAERDGRNIGVGLLFAGSPQVTLAIPIRNVFDTHGRLAPVGGDDEPEPTPPPTLLQQLINLIRRLFGWI